MRTMRGVISEGTCACSGKLDSTLKFFVVDQTLLLCSWLVVIKFHSLGQQYAAREKFSCFHKNGILSSCKTKPLQSRSGLQTTKGLVRSGRWPHHLNAMACASHTSLRQGVLYTAVR